MSTQSEINRIEQAKTDIAEAITAKGVTVPSGTKIDGMSSLIASISQSEDLSAELTEYARLNAELEATIDSLPEAGSGGGSGGGGGSVETCSVEIMADAPMMGGEAMFYTNASMVVVEDSMTGTEWMTGKTVTVVKGTILVIEVSAQGWSITGSATELVDIDEASFFAINGDCSIVAG